MTKKELKQQIIVALCGNPNVCNSEWKAEHIKNLVFEITETITNEAEAEKLCE